MIHHVTLECHPADAAAHRTFWTALGFTQIDPPRRLRERAAWFAGGGTQIHLLWTEDPVVPAQGHVAVRVDDLGDLVGIELEERARHWGERRCYARSPGGHTVELFERGPPQSQS